MKACTFDFSKMADEVVLEIEETGRWGALYFPDTNRISVHPDTIGYETDAGRMRIAVSSIIHELGHAVDHQVLADEDREKIKPAFVCTTAPCTHGWRDYRYLDRYTEAFADAFVAAYTPVYEEMRPVRRTHKFNRGTLSTIREVLGDSY